MGHFWHGKADGTFVCEFAGSENVALGKKKIKTTSIYDNGK